MARTSLLLRWSWRDLRAHWANVLAIGLVIAIGTGGYAGLTSNANWRRTSYAENFSRLAMHDVRVHLVEAGAVPQGTLDRLVASIGHASSIEAAEERLVIPTQVGTTGPDGDLIVRGEIVGADYRDGGPTVDTYHAFTGRLLDQGDAGRPLAMLDRLFSRHYELPDTGTIEIGGGGTLDYVGQATTPEYFAVSPEGEIFLSEASFAGVFTTLETAQAIAGSGASVNELVATLEDGADREVVAEELEVALAGAGIGAEVTTRDDNAAYRTLTNDVDNDQKMFNTLAVLLFLGAVVGAYIMIHRLTQQQRREIGVAMALGVPGRRIAIRPLLVSAQIALLGVVFGVVVGLLVGRSMQGLLESLVPLPVWDTSFQARVFAGVALVGFFVPFLATAVPVWQAVRVRPIEAIKPMYHKAVPMGRRSRRTHARGTTFTRMPLHNLRRSPWRSGFTTAAVALALTVLVAFLGLMDSIFAAIDVAEREAIGDTPDRVIVNLTSFVPVDSPAIARIAAIDMVARSDPTLQLGGALSVDDVEFPAILQFVDLQSGLWHPSLSAGAITTEPGLVLAEEAVKDLGVGIGDMVTLRHPQRAGASSYVFAEDDYPVIAVHPYPIRGFVYMDAAHAGLMGLAGIGNVVQVVPAPGVEGIDLQRRLFAVPGVASVQDVGTTTQSLRDQMATFTGIIRAIILPVILLVMLIAFLTASVNFDARAREHATMFAFGVPVRSALAMGIAESCIIGALATALGFAGGVAVLQWMTQRLVPTILPEVGMASVLRPETVALGVALGVLAVGLAPVFTARRMMRMDLPGTLRIVE